MMMRKRRQLRPWSLKTSLNCKWFAKEAYFCLTGWLRVNWIIIKIYLVNQLFFCLFELLGHLLVWMSCLIHFIVLLCINMVNKTLGAFYLCWVSAYFMIDKMAWLEMSVKQTSSLKVGKTCGLHAFVESVVYMVGRRIEMEEISLNGWRADTWFPFQKKIALNLDSCLKCLSRYDPSLENI